MIQVNIHEAKTRLSELLVKAQQGEEVVIANAGVPIVRLTPVAKRRKRKFGVMKGKFWISDDFDAPLPEDIMRAFYGEDETPS